MNFHHYPVDLQIVVFGNDDEEDVLELRRYLLKLCEGTKCILHDAVYAPGAVSYTHLTLPTKRIV